MFLRDRTRGLGACLRVSTSAGETTLVKRAYRYLITASSGCLAEQAKEGSHVIDWTYFGRGHTWTVFDFSSGEVSGAMTGVYVDKGHKTDDGKFEPDA